MAPALTGVARLSKAPPACQRFGLLLLTCSLAFSGYFSYELPSVTFEQLKASLQTTNAELGLAFSLYALPNTVMPLLAGVVYHKLGVWRGLIGIACIISVGIAVICLAVQERLLWLFLLGRFLYGLVGESSLVGIEVLVADWFRYAEIGLAMGLGRFCAGGGSAPGFCSAAAAAGIPLPQEALRRASHLDAD